MGARDQPAYIVHLRNPTLPCVRGSGTHSFVKSHLLRPLHDCLSLLLCIHFPTLGGCKVGVASLWVARRRVPRTDVRLVPADSSREEARARVLVLPAGRAVCCSRGKMAAAAMDVGSGAGDRIIEGLSHATNSLASDATAPWQGRLLSSFSTRCSSRVLPMAFSSRCTCC